MLGLVVAVGLSATAGETPPNSLSPEEKTGGWRLLFDGQSLQGWRPFGKPSGAPIAKGWKVEEGALQKLAGQKGGDIVTDSTYENYEFAWEWRVAKGANNGVKYLVMESRPQAPGHEYQMIDDDAFSKLNAKNKTGAFYDVLPPIAAKPLPAGEWNVSRIVVQGNRVEHWLNGTKVLEYELGSESLKSALANSKFKKYSDFGTKIRGNILLTDHNDEAWFRNLKIRELTGPKP